MTGTTLGMRVLLAMALLTALPVQAQGVEYIHTDALGTPIAVTDASGTVIDRFEYEPYGLQVAGPVEDGPGYTGQVEDTLTGMTYMQQRYYDPVVERFLSVDPVTAYDNPVAQFHRYRYANNNPYNFGDPNGRFAVWVHWRITYSAARDAGRGFWESVRHANRAWVVDRERGSQARTPEAAAQHAMRAGIEMPAGAAARHQALVANAIARGDLGLAAHATQDMYAKGHRDFALWEGFSALGFRGALAHLWADIFPSSTEVAGAYNATKDIFEGTGESGSEDTGSGAAGGGVAGSQGICGPSLVVGCNGWDQPMPTRLPEQEDKWINR